MLTSWESKQAGTNVASAIMKVISTLDFIRCVFPHSYVTLTVRLVQGTAEAVMFLSVQISTVSLLGLSGSAHLQLETKTHNTHNELNYTSAHKNVSEQVKHKMRKAGK